MEAAALLALLALLFGGRKKVDAPKPAPEDRPRVPAPVTPPSQAALPPASPQAALPAPGVNVFASAWKVRTTALVKRGASGTRWMPMLSKVFFASYPTAGASANDAAVGAARWVGIESGGKASTTTSLNERGLAQGMKENYSTADWAIVSNPKATDEQHAGAAVRLIMKDVRAVTGASAATAGTVGLGYLYHGLPLMVRELREQKLLRGSVSETLVLMLASYKPSSKVAGYVRGTHATTGNVVQDIALRFLGPAAVVAYGDSAVTLLDAIAKGPSPNV